MFLNRMRHSVLLGLLLLPAVCRGGVIQYILDAPSSLPSNATTGAQSYTYLISDLTLEVNQELDIRFDPSVYLSIFDGVAGPGFDLLLLQPNNPPGSPGDYSALALVNNPSWSGTFSVDFLANGNPGAQEFFINQYDPNGNFLGVVDSGITIAVPVPGEAPEPGTLALTGVIIAAGVFRRALLRS